VHVEPVAARGEAPLPAFQVRIGIVFGLEWSRDKRAAGERELRARRERRRLGRLVAALLGRALVEAAMTAQPLDRTGLHPLDHLVDVVLRWSLRLVKA
jgi:hypothetical protein